MSSTIWNSDAAGSWSELPPVVDAPTIARGLGRSRVTVNRWLADGTLPGAVHIPGNRNRLGLPLADLIAFCTPVPVQPINRGQ